MTQLFLTVLNMSLTSCYVILIVLFVRLLLKKAPKIFSYVLWLVVLIRLICPFAPEGKISFLPRPAVQPFSPVTAPLPVSDIASTQSDRDMPPSDKQPRDGFMIHDYREKHLGSTSGSSSRLPDIASAVWGIGALLLLACLLLSALRVKNSLAAAKRLHGQVFETPRIKTPFTFGLFCPEIYLPCGLSAEEREYIVLHEQIHIRRMDPAFKWIACLVLCVHWFNPLVWLSFRFMGRDMEMSCDEAVMKKLEKRGGAALSVRKAYTSSIVSLASGRKSFTGPFPGFGKNGIKERIKNILHYKKPALLLVVLAGIVIAGAAAGLLVNPSSGKETPPFGPENTSLSIGEPDPSQPGTPAPASQSGGLTFPFRMGRETAALSNGRHAEVSLAMTDGRLWNPDDPDYLPGGFFRGDKVYVGRFELSVVLDGKTVSVLPVSFPGSEDGIWHCYDSVSFAFTDYNGDGDPDFTLGQWENSSSSSYNIYTVRRDGTLEQIFYLPAHYSNETSVLLEQPAAGCFVAGNYNNASGETEKILYRWEKDTFREEEFRIEDFYDDLNQTGLITSDTWKNFRYPLLAMTEDKSVMLYGDHNGTGRGGVVRVKDQEVFFDDWSCLELPLFRLPLLYTADPDSDGTDEIICILPAGSGTGVSIQELHLLEPYEGDDYKYKEVRGYTDLPLHNDYLFEEILQHLTWSQSEDGSALELTLNGAKTRIHLDDMSDGSFTRLGFGSIVHYFYENGTITLTASPEFYFDDFPAPLFTDVILKASITYDGNGGFHPTDMFFQSGEK